MGGLLQKGIVFPYVVTELQSRRKKAVGVPLRTTHLTHVTLTSTVATVTTTTSSTVT